VKYTLSKTLSDYKLLGKGLMSFWSTGRPWDIVVCKCTASKN